MILAYGALAYFAFLASFALLADFVAGIGVVRSIDAGATADMRAAIAIDLALVAVFGISHSVMARPAFKRVWTRIVPASAERSTYVLVASLSLGLLVWQWRAVPDVVWHVEQPAVRAALWAVHLVGVATIVYSTFLTNHFDLFGLRQTWLAAQRRPYTPVPFVERSLYRYVRHPMMIGVLLWMWAAPTISIGRLLFASAMTAYILIGIAFEERGLARELGATYDDYRRRVPALIPRLRG